MKALLPWLLASAFVPTLRAAPPEPPALPAAPFAFGDVQLLDSPFRAAMERNASYLLSLDPDRLLHNAREYAGLKPKAPIYGGWESTGVGGHILGHFLTAASQQYAVTSDRRFLDRINYIVGELALCQAAYGDGYVGCLPPLELATLRGFGRGIVRMRDSESFVGGAWAPWYTEHKILNGLKDAWVLAGNTQAKAVALRLADWFGAMTDPLSPDQLQAMLGVEQGGVVDVLAELSALTGNPRYLEVSGRFRHHEILDPLLARRDELVGHHANTNIPKIIGEARTYEVTGSADSRAIATTFWDLVTQHHSYVIGGNSDDEHFFREAETPTHIGASSAETCNTYNMLKLTEHLFAWAPGTGYADFYERALYNDILASQEPRRGMFTYFMSLAPGLFRTYSTPDAFWCCVGTGIENHTRYGRAIYFHGADQLYVNLFIPSQLTWAAKGLVLRQETDYPQDGEVRLTVAAEPTGPVDLRIRCPGWAAGPLAFQLNGRPYPAEGAPGTYAILTHSWHQGDRVTFRVPMEVRAEAMPGGPDRMAFLYGPAVLAGDLGPAPSTDSVPYTLNQRANLKAAAVAVPSLLPGAGSVAAGIERAKGRGLEFHFTGLGRPVDIPLRPFWEVAYDRYTVYWVVEPGPARAARAVAPANGL
jgi:DUF1680 family protein